MSEPPPLSLDTMLAQWRRERPDLDPAPMAVCGAIWRAAEQLRRGVAANLAPHGLDSPAFDVLMTLRRQGAGRALSPTELARAMLLSTSAMTNRLDRLEQRGLIHRHPDPQDRRAFRIALTQEGLALADRVVASHVATEARLLAPLSGPEQAQLRALLERLFQP